MNKTKRNRLIKWGVSGAALLAIAIALDVSANAFGGALDTTFLGGKTTVVDDGSDLDANYIDYKFKTQEEALENAQKVTQETAEEGMTLLKNEDNCLPLSKNAKVTILGYNSRHNNMAGGEDPSTTNGAISLGKGIENAFDTNSAVNSIYANTNSDFSDPNAALSDASATFKTYDTAIITIKRNSGEGNDQSLTQGASEQNRTGLTFTNAELSLVDFACDNFSKVILVINSANTMELGFLNDDDPYMNDGYYTDPYNTSKKYNFSKVKAAIWAGCCGSQGGTALANILNGSVNPSGHLADTYISDLTKDPTYKNFGSYKYSNSSSLNSYQEETFFVEYEEGIYVGYRYYETADYEASKGNYDGFSYDESVVFPFGYGLSYTDFEFEYSETPTYDEKTGNYEFKVKVTNTGSVAGKATPQIYVNVPYEKGQVEKSHVSLGGFAKTSTLAAGASEVVTITINEDYFTSYDYKDNKCYILDKGDYNFYLSENSHSWKEIDSEDSETKAKHLWTRELTKKYIFNDANDGKRKTDLSTAVNKEDDELNYKFKAYDEGSTGDGYVHDFTRSNFAKSFPTSPTGNDFVMTNEKALKQVAKYNVWLDENNPIAENQEYNVDKTSYTLAEMRGVAFDDPKWDDYINQFTIDSMTYMFCNGGWMEAEDDENGVPKSIDADSPYGFYAGALSIGNINKWYCGAPMVAATWNVELAKKIGDAFGEEAYANQYYNNGTGTLITGLYGFGLNSHRSAFGGRNYEYYSEDAVLSGKMAASEASGASEKGLILFMKHFALNEQETNRQKNGYCAYVNEQAFRENYTRGWEIYIKEAKMQVKYYSTDSEGKYNKDLATTTMSAATGIMTSYNRIGANWAGASVSLIGILRDEFGYTGSTITDAGGQPNTYMTTDYMLRRGGNLTLANNGTNGLYDNQSNTAIYYLKDATKHTLFNKANSNIMVGIAPGASVVTSLATWKIILYTMWGVVAALLAADVAWMALIATDKVKTKEKVAVTVNDNSDEF